MSWKKNGRSSHYDVTLSDQTATAPFTRHVGQVLVAVDAA